MGIKEIERLAKQRNVIMPDALTIHEQILFQGLRYLHAQHGMKVISKEQALKEKMKLISECKRSVAKETFRLKQAFHTVAMWKEVELILSAYQKEPTIENADKLVVAINGQVRGWNELKEEV